MKIRTSRTVWEAALDRIRFLFDEFEFIMAAFSGGKDSTVVLNLCLKVAEEKGRLPLRVMFIDQEAEWDAVVDYAREVMSDPRIHPMWMQFPFKIFNATSNTDHWINCWKEGDEWMREREEVSIKENRYGTDRFHQLFNNILNVESGGGKACLIAGVRCEESPNRFLGLTSGATYKWITWGKALSNKRQQYTFYPLYDWSYQDIWHAIHSNGWRYCKIYDYMYQYGVSLTHMRVSSLHHETAVYALFFMQEIEPENWNRLTKRLSGINTAAHMGSGDYFIGKDLPYMFGSWKEYRDYLLENLITDEDVKKLMKDKFDSLDETYKDLAKPETLHKAEINTILTNDFEFAKLNQVFNNAEFFLYRKYKKGSRFDEKNKSSVRQLPKDYRERMEQCR